MMTDSMTSLDEQQRLGELRERVFDHMLKTRSWKYKAFLRYLRMFKFAARAPLRGEFLESYYTLMRYIDDIVDGDLPLPDPYPSVEAYVLEKIDFAQNPGTVKDEVDSLMLYCFDLARRFHENFQYETEDILNSLLFDARRRGTNIIFRKHVLDQHFHIMDIRGTIKATLKIFNEDPDKYLLLKPLGMASRYQYDIEDVKTDLANGYINISQEECEQLGITEEDITDPYSQGVKRWLLKHAKEGMEFLKEHDKRVRLGHFSMVARATFPLVYAMPARTVFKKTIRDLEGEFGSIKKTGINY